ncbi:MAG: ABC transporter permease [Deltaproteobacteria bacterium]|nr:ABC transporter permease [Deltaproteobacteria bacterium]
MSLRVDGWEGARIALHSLRANRLRTVLTTAGIGIGVATLLAIVGIIQGLNASFAAQLSSLGTNSLYVSKFPWVMKGSWWEYRNRKNLTLEHAEALRKLPHVVAVSPQVNRVKDVTGRDNQLSSVSIMGAVPDYLEVSAFELAAGRFLVEADEGGSVAVLGADVAEALFQRDSPLGASIRVGERPFRVVGVLGRKGKLLGQSQDLVVVIPLNTHRRYFGRWRSLSIGVAVDDPAVLDKVEDQVVGALRRLRSTPPDKEDDFSINRPEQLAATYEQLTSALFAVAVGVGFITLLVGGIGIMNIMLVSVRERTREIGVRRALGARRRTIVLQFLMEASAVSALGGALGTAAGLGAAKVVSLVTPLSAAVQPLTVVAGVGFSAVVGLLFGIWPAARAARLDPVEALRYE